jgi:hypothetical protein
MTIRSPLLVGIVETRTSMRRPCDLLGDAAVLREALLGDVEAGLDLHARHDRVARKPLCAVLAT